MNDFFDTVYASGRAEVTIVVMIALVIYPLYYKRKHHRKICFIEHPYYIALWAPVIMNIFLMAVCTLFPIEYTERMDDIVRKVILVVAICNFYLWREISLRKTGKK